ncbi:uncharacterized protein LOC143281915 [Babylonia areolata]|uniref:uncharacterized protein LOC143281915 n=1 Tax=Babylonia areolata TaxID=304850 RepID=UPI003FD45ECC
MLCQWWRLLLLLVVYCVVWASSVQGGVASAGAADHDELVVNGGFESPLSGGQWRCHSCSVSRRQSSDSHGGLFALKVTSRTKFSQGPGLPVQVQGGTRYQVQVYVKQLNDVTKSLFQDHMLRFVYHYGDSRGGSESRKVAQRSMIRSDDGWFSITGHIIVPNRTVSKAELRHLGPDAGISYLLDDVSVREIAEDSRWREHADARIERVRKGDIHLRFTLPSSVRPDDVTVQVDHKKHLFGFGSLVKDEFLVDPHYRPYQDFVYSLFNVATLQSFKWKFDKGTRNHPNFTRSVIAMNALKAHGLEVRGHNLFWGFTKNLPEWVPALPLHELNVTVQDRLHYMVNITKGQLLHWDVMNELLHGQWFEETFKDPLFTQRLFRQLKGLDPRPTLMLNDFRAVCMPDITDAYLQQARQYLANGVPLEALGIQSHFKDEERPDPTLIQIRLDHLAQSGLPLWVTELNLNAEDPGLRADLYEKVYRLYFSHPAVQGIVLWGFWDQQTATPLNALVEGHSFTMNEAGRRIARLIQDEWSTHARHTLSSGETSLIVRGFKGDYDVTVNVKGVPVRVETLSLVGESVTVSITLSADEAPVTLPRPHATLVPPLSGATTTTNNNTGDHSLGNATSSASSSFPALRCVSRWSSFGGRGRHAQVTCEEGEVLTGCSSVGKNRGQGQQGGGERVEFLEGRPVCVAGSDDYSSEGVQASAVCCSGRGLTCVYHAAGPSPIPSSPSSSSPSFPSSSSFSTSGHQDTVQTVCPSSQHLLGCSAWFPQGGVGGVTMLSNTCRPATRVPTAGVHVSSACCSAPLLSCVTVTSSPSGPNQGDVARVRCDEDYAMTSCHALSHQGQLSLRVNVTGPAGSECQTSNEAQLGQDQTGVKAVAVCCKLSEDGLIGK